MLSPTRLSSRIRLVCATRRAATRTSRRCSPWPEQLSQAEENLATAREMLTEATGEDRQTGQRRDRPGHRGHRGARGATELHAAAQGPQHRAQRHRRDPRRRRWRGGEPLRQGPLRDVPALRRATRMAPRGPLLGPVGSRRPERGHVHGEGPRRLDPHETRGWYPPRPACAGDRVPGPDPHLGGHGHGAPRSRRGRGVHRRRPTSGSTCSVRPVPVASR